jgi:leucyl aminopeptidase
MPTVPQPRDSVGGVLAIDKTLGEQVGNATNWAKDLVNEPAGWLTPSRLAQEAEIQGMLGEVLG